MGWGGAGHALLESSPNVLLAALLLHARRLGLRETLLEESLGVGGEARGGWVSAGSNARESARLAHASRNLNRAATRREMRAAARRDRRNAERRRASRATAREG